MNSNDDLIGTQLRLAVGSAMAILGCSAGVRQDLTMLRLKRASLARSTSAMPSLPQSRVSVQ
ncbi:MAG: hypothetical protein VYA69_13310 [Gemmatimonadota bacterium]|nr:hypothetical protein [Gemmatimonadota bacterium]